ncbi:aminotransferase [Pyrococcus furiosus DSM 3638]|uniref:histidinol-phosphate transaminase n=3 Tax=Pyrococcus furiosus TaxID=2261 RepID=A0A5C0XTD6_PYRFU|nr:MULTISPECIES: aminotransferase class I/II-fold pyridoxal phosphate-dependent enzyme [Pyrococcus]AAL80417.1 histidinol-phosphate aminotransferase [Pyrococcus furiosus DSM 3638]AFN03080.1 aminotransferase [Pyrococcus furiosus COM1]MDK2870132.1 histidinol-phosphate aminotransferase [Pyrococcus sp.]QEK78010.1 aminotransferase [Pyrococcus furiosus DSM 3638]
MINQINFKTSHGGSREEGYIDFSASVNPYPPEWTDEMFERAKKISTFYPYYEKLEEELSDLIGEPITITAGITEALYLLGVWMRGRKVIIPKHTYGEYERISRMFGGRVIKGPNDPGKLAEFVERNSFVFFCNPNNPDGKFYREKEMKPLLDAIQDTNSILILDEAFIDFVKKPESPEGENIIRLRTFTKSYGLPGVRVGYVIGFVDAFRSVRMPWSIGSTGVAFLEFLLKDNFKHLRKTLPLIWKEKERIEKELKVKSDANFFIMKVREGIIEKLKENGILVRDCKSFGLPGYIRFSVRRREENDKLINILRKTLNT